MSEFYLKQMQAIQNALNGSAWTAEEEAETIITFAEHKLTDGKFQLSVHSDHVITDICEITDNFYPSSWHKSRYGLNIEQAWALYDSVMDLRKRLRLALSQAENPSTETKRFWMRVGVSFDLTLEEFAEVETGSKKGKQLLLDKLKNNLYQPDGDSYAPATDEETDDMWSHGEIGYDF